MSDLALKYKIAGVLLVLAATFAAGRYSVSGKIETKKVDTAINQDKTDHKKIVIDRKSTGEITTTITDESETKTKEVQQVVETKTNAAAKRNILNVSALAANDFAGTKLPVYGVSVNKEVLGPVTVGVFGLTNGVIGLSVGIDF